MEHDLQQISSELKAWQKQMLRRPSFFNKLSKKIQTKINSWIPEKVHKAITATIKANDTWSFIRRKIYYC